MIINMAYLTKQLKEMVIRPPKGKAKDPCRYDVNTFDLIDVGMTLNKEKGWPCHTILVHLKDNKQWLHHSVKFPFYCMCKAHISL